MERVSARVVGMTGGGRCLLPTGDEAVAVFSHLKEGEIISIAIYRERNRRFSAKVNLVLERVAKLRGMRVRNMRGWLAAKTGRADMVNIDGTSVLVPWPTSPRDMSAAEFSAFWDDAKPHLRELVKGLPEEDDIIETISD